ncbi:MAG: isocitrate lyase [Halomonas sp.]|nr:isocitrate lyase [Halomonas sp.]
MTGLLEEIKALAQLREAQGGKWDNIKPEYAARMRAQNRFHTGLDIARYTAKIMREDMAAYDADTSKYTQSLGCWHGFIGQQKMLSIKKHFGTTWVSWLSIWLISSCSLVLSPASLASFRALDDAKEAGDKTKEQELISQIDNHETHVVPIIADIDAGFGNAEATYLLAKKFIEAGACCIQLENQVSDEKQCGHQDGKVTVPHEDFIAKINAVRYAFLELGVEDGVIVARTDSLGAGLTQKIAVTNEPGDLGDQYNSFLDGDVIENASDINNGDVVIKQNGKLVKPKRLASGLYQFKPGTGEDRVVLDCITSLQNGADLLWIETEKPHVGQIAAMVNRIREVCPDAKLVYNNSPSFNWTLNFRQQVFDAWEKEGKDVSAYERDKLMGIEYDNTELGQLADEWTRNFQRDGAREAGIFHHLITLPTYHTAALSTDNLAKGYFGDDGMLAYVKKVQREEIRQGIATVRHQDMAGSNIGDDHKEFFHGYPVTTGWLK